MVTCTQCGEQFDANKGFGHYDKVSKRYICKPCYNEMTIGMRQSYFAMILKIIFWILIIIIGFIKPQTGDWTIGYFLFCLIIGLLLLASGIIPYKTRKKPSITN